MSAPARWAAFALLILAAAAVRTVRLGADGLWVDEAYTALLTRGSPSQILRDLRQDDAPPLFYFLEKGVLAMAGRSEAAARALPAACGLGTVLAAWVLARRHLPRAAWLIAVLFAFSSVAAFYSRQARGYSLLHLLSVLLLLAALEYRLRPTRGAAAGMVAASLALLYTHNLGVLLVLPALALAAQAHLEARRPRRPLLILLLALLLGALPWGWRLLGQVGVNSALNWWIGEWWKKGPPLALGPFYSWAAFTNASAGTLRLPLTLPAPPGALRSLCWVLWALAAGGLAGALWALLARAPERAAGRAAVAGALLFAYVPLLGLVILTPLTGPVYVVGRTDTLALPGFLLAVGAGLQAYNRRLLARSAAILWAATGLLSMGPLFNPASSMAKESDRMVAAILGREIHPRDAVVLGPLARPSLEYYARRGGWWERPRWIGSFPAALDRNAAATVPTPLDSASAYFEQAIELRHRWEEQGCDRVFLLAVAADSDPPSWPLRPSPPPQERRTVEANHVSYPMNLLMAALIGLRPAEVEWEYHQDWVGAPRFIVRLPRAQWVSPDSLPKLEVRR